MGSSRFARRYSGNRIFFLFLRILRCFSSPGLPHVRYVFTYMYCPITGSGFPHSEISGSMLTYSSPEHIGVSAVLHRLLVPRHPPCALSNLTRIGRSFRHSDMASGSLQSVACSITSVIDSVDYLCLLLSMSFYPVFKEQVGFR